MGLSQLSEGADTSELKMSANYLIFYNMPLVTVLECFIEDVRIGLVTRGAFPTRIKVRGSVGNEVVTASSGLRMEALNCHAKKQTKMRESVLAKNEVILSSEVIFILTKIEINHIEKSK